MEKVRPYCGQPSDRGQLKNRTEQNNCGTVQMVRCELALMGRYVRTQNRGATTTTMVSVAKATTTAITLTTAGFDSESALVRTTNDATCFALPDSRPVCILQP